MFIGGIDAVVARIRGRWGGDSKVALSSSGLPEHRDEPLTRRSSNDSVVHDNFSLAPKTSADLYKARWQIEIFFIWIKQHLTHQGTLRHIRERRAHSNLHPRVSLRPRRHR